MVQCFKTFCFLSLLLSTRCFAGGVHLKFIGIDTTRGQLAIAIFDQRNASSFPERGDLAIYREFITPSDFGVRINLPSNKRYAVSVFHDLNMDQKLNTNFFGIPKEPLGFSNNPRLLFGPPTFLKASFFVGENYTTKLIRVKKY